MTFIDEVISGEATVDDIDSYRAAWDSSDENIEYHEFLGLLWPEYAMYVEEDDVLSYVVEARRHGKDLRSYLEPRRNESRKMTKLWGLVQRYAADWEALRP
jgi:hypothetical protein